MEQYLSEYGALPEDLGLVDISISEAEMCFVQYLPIKIPNSKSLYTLPANLKWCEELIQKAFLNELNPDTGRDYVYLTVKRVYGTGNREGWHCDGFGTDHTNYIWYDSHPTEFYAGNMLELPFNHSDSMRFMENNIGDPDDKILYMCKHLIRMDQSSIHRVNPESFTGLRTFVKISFSDEKYNLKGNAHNYGLNYDWSMVERKPERNHPTGEIK